MTPDSRASGFPLSATLAGRSILPWQNRAIETNPQIRDPDPQIMPNDKAQRPNECQMSKLKALGQSDCAGKSQ